MKAFVAQWIAAMTANLAMLNAGLHHGWSSPMLPKLLSGEDELKLTKGEAAWSVSILSVGAIVGHIVARVMVDSIGRKRSLLWMALPFLVSWIIIGLAADVETLYVGRFAGGVGTGSVICLCPIYATEIAEDKIRGALAMFTTTMVSGGMLLSYSTGPWISRQMLAIIAAIPCLLFLITFIHMPESPYYYLVKDREEDAQKSLVWLRQRLDVSEELERIKTDLQKRQHNSGSFLEIFKVRGNRKAAMITTVLTTFQQLSGATAIQSYASMIFHESGFVISDNISVIIMGIVKLSVCIITFFMVDKLGRKPMLIISALSSSIMLTCEAIFFNVKYASVDTSSISWLPLFGVLGFCITYAIGLGNMPLSIISEVFPMNVKAAATMMLAIYASVMIAIVTKVYQVVESEYGAHVTFYGFAVITIMCVPYTYFCVPETKGQSLQDIQNNLNKSVDDINGKQSGPIWISPEASGR